MLASASFLALIIILAGCSPSNQEKAKQREEQAKAKARQAEQRFTRDARKLGHEVKQDANSFTKNFQAAMNSSGPADGGTSQPEKKLEQGGHDLRVEAGKAGTKLDHAALVAKVKAKLAADVGLSTVTSVDVDTTGQVVTLRGTVNSVQQRELAEQAALQVNGVTKVIDHLQVNPGH
jgi:hyperosmotically inducible protein